ncbi:sucrose-6-phosphate hydrolase [Terribacillus saccharophilus]|uniref:glycoside hydrolase family 32 protein n=1 Tax=Terribacillus saccharophilus TaxID=361277 RepID=UPI003981F90D
MESSDKVTNSNKYRLLSDASPDELTQLARQVNASPWRQHYHIQPNTGLLNDPNGFAHYNGQYHLFYQWHPFGPVHGMKYWYHVTSTDLVHWEDAGVGIEPGDPYDSHGAYSGSALAEDGVLYLFYTGNTRDEDWSRHPYQCLAVLDQQGHISKQNTPIIESPPLGYTDHFRDPKVWKAADSYYAVLGAQRLNQTGCVLVYRSDDLQNWSLTGELETSLTDFGYMWECPDYFELGEKGVLLFCPQGLPAEKDRFENIHQAGFLLGEQINPEKPHFHHGSFTELDRGFDFYAAQTTLTPDGRRILIGWMGLPDTSYPTDTHGWAHCLTLPRELTIENGKLMQRPVKEMELLRKESYTAVHTVQDSEILIDEMYGSSYELHCAIHMEGAAKAGITFRTGDTEETLLYYDTLSKYLILDRTRSGQTMENDTGSIRRYALDAKMIDLHLFVDQSSVEVFINDGEAVMTARIFPAKDSNGVAFFTEGGKATFDAVHWLYT